MRYLLHVREYKLVQYIHTYSVQIWAIGACYSVFEGGVGWDSY